jgi:GT2 family glycosyltransferase
MISIIIPAYNSSATIVEALESVAAQTYWAAKTSDLRLQTSDQGEGETTDHKLQTIDLGEGEGEGGTLALAKEGSRSTVSAFDRSEVCGLKSEVSPAYEVIIVDDCSTDDTVEVVREWMREKEATDYRLQTTDQGEQRAKGEGHGAKGETSDIRLQTSRIPNPVSCLRSEVWCLMSEVCGLWSIVSLPANGGPAKARNHGIREARGEWIAFLDADDAWLPGKMELQMAFLDAHPEAAMICGDYIGFADDKTAEDGQQKTVDGRQGTADGGPHFHPITLEELACHNPVATSTVVVKKAVLEVVGGFDEQFRGPEDYDLWIRVAALGQRGGQRAVDGGRLTVDGKVENYSCCIMHVAVPVSCYRQVPGSLSMDDRKFLPQVLRVLDKAWEKGGALHGKGGQRRARGYHHLACAWMAAERGVLGRAVVLWIMTVYYWPLPLRGRQQNIPWAHVKVLWRILSQVKRRYNRGGPSVTAGAI